MMDNDDIVLKPCHRRAAGDGHEAPPLEHHDDSDEGPANTACTPLPIAMVFLAIASVLFIALPSTQLRVPVIKSSSSTSRANRQVSSPLAFRPDGTFQLSIFEDLHFGENAWDAWGPQQDINSVRVINTVLDAEPDTGLVVLNGDLITGENTFRENSSLYIDQIVAPLVAHSLPWASTYGNHDSDYNISRLALLAREAAYPNARTTRMVLNDDAGVTNYFLPVYPSDCRVEPSCTPELILWFFDSRGGFQYQERNASTGQRVGQPDWVDHSVVDWFYQTNAVLTQRAGGKPIPSLGFVHIPTEASRALQQNRTGGIDPRRQPGINQDIPVSQQGQGWCADGRNDGTCAYGGQDVPFMQAITSTPGFMALFSGHDHGNTWCAKWDGLLPGMTVKGNGVNLCFGQHSGYGGYGSWIRGARQVVVTRKKLKKLEVHTYIRLESGKVVGAVTLNATYGKDEYPITPDDRTRCMTCLY
ncbi:Metallo-dependent phosphatase-like protein [Podospora appendiculata]|uniref:Metallo-dependent phosphatase-like protein n=1 Tax=Podospora appendiculata TaxID=314037 RepID=A0AAE1CDC5_9PEZI|nr:Metallo-dependent phosphatase-like protein [Podospora appendiculata]